MRPIAMSFLVAAALVAFRPAMAGELLEVEVNKYLILPLDKVPGQILVGSPTLVNLEVAKGNKRLVLYGLQAGTTDLLLLDKKSNEIAHYDLVITPSANNMVNVTRIQGEQGATVTTMSCGARCTETETVENQALPGTIAAQNSPTTSTTDALDTTSATTTTDSTGTDTTTTSTSQ